MGYELLSLKLNVVLLPEPGCPFANCGAHPMRFRITLAETPKQHRTLLAS
jgi:hypothetical protein